MLSSLLSAGSQVNSGVPSSFQRLGNAAALNVGVDPAILSAATAAALRSPEEQTSDLFSALEPFETATTERNVAQLREGQSALGGRFGRSATTGEGRLRSELATGFQKNRQQALLQAAAQRIQALSALAPVALQSQLGPLSLMFRFLQPGAAENIFREGIAPGLIGAAGNLAALKLFAGGGGGGGATTRSFSPGNFGGEHLRNL